MPDFARRILLVLAIATLSACMHAAPARSPGQVLLQQAIDAAGGEAALSRARVLHWTGEASVSTGDKRIELGVESSVEPFVAARSDTWLLDQGRATLRTLQIDGEQGAMIRGGATTPMPQPMLRHEQAQYAIYGLMRLLPLRDAGVHLRELHADKDGLRGLHVEHPRAPAADMFFDARGRLAYVTDQVPDPDGNGSVAQRFDFEGSIEAGGVRWPRILRISQNGKSYFELRLQKFSVEP